MIMLQARQLIDMTDGSTLQLRRQMPLIEYQTIMPGCLGPGDVATTKDSLDGPTEEELLGDEEELKKKYASDAKGHWHRHAFLIPGPNIDELGQENPDTIRGPYGRYVRHHEGEPVPADFIIDDPEEKKAMEAKATKAHAARSDEEERANNKAKADSDTDHELEGETMTGHLFE